MTDRDHFVAALHLSAAERASYFAANCPDAIQRERVESLLLEHERLSGFLEPPKDFTRTDNDGSATVDAGPTAGIGDRIGPYKLLEKIGEGGMGEVWVADQLEPIKRRVALKLIKPGMDSRSVLGRFEAERQALAVMDHPNIAKVLDAGTTSDGRPYFVMELVKGTPITEFCDARKLTPKQRLELFVPVCQAIQHAHMKGIIHRDIKPSNVLVALHDEVPVPKVIDFGVAKAVGQQLTDKTIYTGFGALVGTPAYMAPEQATFNQLDVDTRADVYALGVLLYELLAGSPPIERERMKKAALDEMLRIVREEEPPRPSHRLSTSQAKATIAATRGSEPAKLSQLMKGEIDWIVMKALEKDRTRRYETANGLAKDVQRYLKGDAVEACPPTLGYRLKKVYLRNKPAVWVSAAFVVLIVGWAVMAAVLTLEAQRARASASADRVRDNQAKTLLQFANDTRSGRIQGGDPWEVFGSGDYATAAKMFELMEKSASSPEDKSGAYHGLFRSEQKLGKLDDARKHAQAAIDVIVKARGLDHRSYKLGMARSNLGVLLSELKKPTAAESHLLAGCREVADFPDQIPAYDYPHRHAAFDHLVRILEQSNRPAEAKKWLAVWQELLDKLVRKTLNGDKLTAATATLVSKTVLAHVAANRHDDALALYRDLNTKYTPANKPTADVWLRLSETVMLDFEAQLLPARMKPWAELRIPPLERDLDALRKTKPAEVPLLRATNTLLFSYLHAGRNAEVIKMVEEVIARQKANGWRTHADAVASYGSTTNAVARAGRPELAIELSTAVLAAVTKAKASPEVLATASYSLGLAQSVAGSQAEAERHFREALRLQAEVDAMHWKAAKYEAWFGFALHEQKMYAEAEQVLTEAYAAWEACYTSAPPWEKQHPLLIANRLATLYEAIKKPDEAAKWKALSEKK